MHEKTTNSEKAKPRLLRKPRQSQRPLPNSTVQPSTAVPSTANEYPASEKFTYIDSAIDYDFITQDDGNDLDPYTEIYQTPPEKNKHKCRRRPKSEFEKKFVLESPLHTANSIVKPRLPRGPSTFPCRPLHRMANLLYDILWDEDDLNYYQVPAFTLNDFLYEIASFSKTPIRSVKKTMLSKQNYKKLTRMLAAQNEKSCEHVATVDFDEQLSSIPVVTSRIPNRHLLMEMAAMVKEQMNQALNTEVKAIIKPLSKYSSPFYPGEGPLTEIVIYESGSGSPAKSVMLNPEAVFPYSHSVADTLLHSATPKYFQGASRSQSPFVGDEGTDLSVAEVSLLDSLAKGGFALSLKAQFLSTLPDITPCIRTLTYLNLSFNDFKVFPTEVLLLHQLTVLKMRNNPLRELPDDISMLVNLRTFVTSFCLLTTIPASLFQLKYLSHLDVSYNKLSFLPNHIKNARSLQELNLEGNQFYAMPCGALKLHNLVSLGVKNNFMHPLFWREATKNEPQRLVDIAAVRIRECDIINNFDITLDEKYKALLDNFTPCDCCGQACYGPGIRIIRPCTMIFGVRNLPFLFVSCSPSCAAEFMKNSDNITNVIYG